MSKTACDAIGTLCLALATRIETKAIAAESIFPAIMVIIKMSGDVPDINSNVCWAAEKWNDNQVSSAQLVDYLRFISKLADNFEALKTIAA